MKLLACLVLPALLSLGAPAGAELQGDDPPPFECPLCGGDRVTHELRVSRVSWLQGRIAVFYVSAVFRG